MTSGKTPTTSPLVQQAKEDVETMRQFLTGKIGGEPMLCKAETSFERLVMTLEEVMNVRF